jgi:nitrate reductase gamma subunit
MAGCGWRYHRDRPEADHPPRRGNRTNAVGSQLAGWGIWAVIAARITDLLTARPGGPTTLDDVIMGVQLAGGVAAVCGAVTLLAPRVIEPRAKPHAGPLDRLTVPLLLAGVVTGIAVVSGPFSITDGDGPAQTLFPWFRSLFTAHPKPDLMAKARVLYRIRAMVVLLLIATWPYTRLGGVITRAARLLAPSGRARGPGPLTPADRATRRR